MNFTELSFIFIRLFRRGGVLRIPSSAYSEYYILNMRIFKGSWNPNISLLIASHFWLFGLSLLPKGLTSALILISHNGSST